MLDYVKRTCEECHESPSLARGPLLEQVVKNTDREVHNGQWNGPRWLRTDIWKHHKCSRIPGRKVVT